MKQHCLTDFRRAFTFFGRFAFQTVSVTALILFALGAATWFTCHDVYHDSIITIYSQMYLLFTWIVPVAFAMSTQYYLSIALSFGGLRKASFWAVELLLFFMTVAMFGCAKGMNVLFLHLPLENPHIPLTLPLAILGMALVLVTTQISLLICSIQNKTMRTAFSIAMFTIPCIGTGVIFGLAATGAIPFLTSMNDFLHILNIAYPWLLASLIALSIILGAWYSHMIKKAVVQ